MKKGAFGKGGRAGKAGALAGKPAKADASKCAAAAAAAPELVWDKKAMSGLLNAVRAESFGEVTLNPAQDPGYLGRLTARVSSTAFKPTDSQICIKLMEWNMTFGGSQEAFEKCEMSVQRSDAAKRHENIWASQAASVSRSAVGDHESKVQRVPRLSYQDTPAAQSSPARASAFSKGAGKEAGKEAGVAKDVPSTPASARPLPAAASSKGKKRSSSKDAASTDSAKKDKQKGKEREKTEMELSEVDDESEEEDNTKGRRTRRKLLYEDLTTPAASAAKPYHPLNPGSSKGKDTTSLDSSASPDTGKTKKAHRTGDAGGGSSSRAAAAVRNSTSTGKGVALRRAAWASSAKDAEKVDPNAGVPGFLLRARTALRDAGGAEKYEAADVSGANEIMELERVLRPDCSGAKGGASPGKKARDCSKAKDKEAAEAHVGGEEEREAVMAWGTTVVRRQMCSNHVAHTLDGLEPQLEHVTQVLSIFTYTCSICDISIFAYTGD